MHVPKPSGTSASTTAFCQQRLDFDHDHLFIDGNGKITAANGTLDAPSPNAFSLVQIEDCPFATDSCKAACYVHGLEKHAPATHALYKHNSQTIRRILRDADYASAWAAVVSDWIAGHCKGGFRWHVSGDVFSPEYARWITQVCQWSPRVRHWIYTRSFDFVEHLMPASTLRGGNLVINLSCDKDNYSRACHTSMRHTTANGQPRLCYMTTDGNVPDTLPEGSVIFPDYSLRGGTPEGQAWFTGLTPQYKSFVCPVDYHGKSEQRRCGPCKRCMV
jgi:hypothetical protein